MELLKYDLLNPMRFLVVIVMIDPRFLWLCWVSVHMM